MHGSFNVEQRHVMLQSLHADEGTLSHDYLAAARHVLHELIAKPELIHRLPLERKSGSYARTLLVGDDQVSVWAIVWDAGSMTSIHDHHCSCCFGVVSGTLGETWYRAIDEVRAVPTDEQKRTAGYVACMLPSGPNIHRMNNTGPGEAISIHIYGFDHEVHSSSIEREYVAIEGWTVAGRGPQFAYF